MVLTGGNACLGALNVMVTVLFPPASTDDCIHITQNNNDDVHVLCTKLKWSNLNHTYTVYLHWINAKVFGGLTNSMNLLKCKVSSCLQ